MSAGVVAIYGGRFSRFHLGGQRRVRQGSRRICIRFSASAAQLSVFKASSLRAVMPRRCLSGSTITSGHCDAVISVIGHRSGASPLACPRPSGWRKCCPMGYPRRAIRSGSTSSLCDYGRRVYRIPRDSRLSTPSKPTPEGRIRANNRFVEHVKKQGGNVCLLKDAARASHRGPFENVAETTAGRSKAGISQADRPPRPFPRSAIQRPRRLHAATA